MGVQAVQGAGVAPIVGPIVQAEQECHIVVIGSMPQCRRTAKESAWNRMLGQRLVKTWAASFNGVPALTDGDIGVSATPFR